MKTNVIGIIFGGENVTVVTIIIRRKRGHHLLENNAFITISGIV